MSEKIKNISNIIDTSAKKLGYGVLAGMATIGMLDMPNHLASRIPMPRQPALAYVQNNIETDEQVNSIRRERDELEPHYISYSEVQRTATRVGKQ
jgi:hypothetical protein